MKEVRGETSAEAMILVTYKMSLSSCGSLRAGRPKGMATLYTVVVRLLSLLGCSGFIVVAWY